MPNYNIPAGEDYPLGLDYAGSRIKGATIRDNTVYSFVVRYLTDGGASLPGKQLLGGEASDLLNADIGIVSNWETWADRMGEGRDAGYSDVRKAWDYHKSIGGTDTAAIYFSADWDATEQDSVRIHEYLQQCINYLGIERVGIYGGYHVVKRARDTFPGLKVWQTLAWSGGNVLDDIELLQRIGFVNVAGVQCDVNELRKPGKVGAWQDSNQPEPEKENTVGIESLVDHKVYTPEEMTQFIDLHCFRQTAMLAALCKQLGGDAANVAKELGL
ncbi:DUF1906 domain-containing protein [Rhodococcus phage P19]|nr:DUF1906 domain-containing protein [Rhodococcus phage P19]